MYGLSILDASMTSDAPLDWLDRARGRPGPLYAAILAALGEAIRAGELQPGDRLPAQRAAATRLGVDLTTMTRAYGEASARGLIESTVGRGAFVRKLAADDEAGLVDLSMNLPPPPDGLSLGGLIAETAAAILAKADASILMAYHPGFGGPGQRAAGARWIAPTAGEVSPERILVAPGAQTALAAVCATLLEAGDTVVADPLTYPGFLSIARQQGLRLLPCPADDQGLEGAAFAELCARERPKAVYLVPTLQNPTATIMPEERRREIARLAVAHNVWIIEDDPYGRLLDAPPPAFAALAPERTFHVATLAKCLSPGLRIAYIACPQAFVEQLAHALRTLALMPPPLMAAVATRWINEGVAERLLAAVRSEARARRAIAAEVLPMARGPAESIHVWLPLAGAAASERLRLGAQDRGLALVTADAFATGQDYPAGARISLGGPASRSVLKTALQALNALTQAGERRPLVV
jgi:DNA-binding transcriptional MocR family regulator